jgi:hypothetical protein
MAAKKGNKYALGNNGGRPPFYDNPIDLQKAIDNYFLNPPERKTIYIEGAPIEIPVLTICGLALYLGFSTRKSLLDYDEKEEFVNIIKKAKTRIENNYEQNLQFPNPTGSIFALKNMGWSDKTEIEHSGNIKETQIIVRDNKEKEHIKKIENDL